MTFFWYEGKEEGQSKLVEDFPKLAYKVYAFHFILFPSIQKSVKRNQRIEIVKD